MNKLRQRMLDPYLDKSKKQKRFAPKYGIFKIENGKLYGYTENSFSMGWELNKVYVYAKKVVFKGWGSAPKDKWAFIVRLSRRNAKIKIGNDIYRIKVEFKYTGGKYDWRNWYFSLDKVA